MIGFHGPRKAVRGFGIPGAGWFGVADAALGVGHVVSGQAIVRPSEFGRSGQISRLNLPSAKETPLHEPVDSCPQPSPRVEGTCLALAGTPSEFAAENPRPGVARSSLLRQNHFGGRAQPWAECCNPVGIGRR